MSREIVNVYVSVRDSVKVENRSSENLNKHFAARSVRKLYHRRRDADIFPNRYLSSNLAEPRFRKRSFDI